MTGTNFLARLQRARFLYIPLGELTTRKEERNLVVENPSTEYEEENRIIEDIKNYRMFKLLGARLRNRTEYASKQLEDNARQVLEAIAKQWKP